MGLFKNMKQEEKPQPQETSLSKDQYNSLLNLRVIDRRIFDMETQLKKKNVYEVSSITPNMKKTEFEFLEELEQLNDKRDIHIKELLDLGISIDFINNFEKEILEGFKSYTPIFVK